MNALRHQPQLSFFMCVKDQLLMLNFDGTQSYNIAIYHRYNDIHNYVVLTLCLRRDPIQNITSRLRKTLCD